MAQIQGIDGLHSLITNLALRDKYLSSFNGQEVNLDQISVFQSGPFLHTDKFDDKEKTIITEEESALFERNYPHIFKFMRELHEHSFRIIKST